MTIVAGSTSFPTGRFALLPVPVIGRGKKLNDIVQIFLEEVADLYRVFNAVNDPSLSYLIWSRLCGHGWAIRRCPFPQRKRETRHHGHRNLLEFIVSPPSLLVPILTSPPHMRTRS